MRNSEVKLGVLIKQFFLAEHCPRFGTEFFALGQSVQRTVF